MIRQCVVCLTEISGQKQKYCGNACKQKGHYDRVKLQTNTYHSQTLRSLRRKVQLVNLFGNKCQKCGYNTNLSALHFHHVNPNQKSFKLDVRILSNKKWELILKEAQKCILLCSNCHAEEHNPEFNYHNVQKIIAGVAFEKSEDEKGVNSGKPYG
jgi:hypothetical protein